MHYYLLLKFGSGDFMDAAHSQIFFPSTLSEFFSTWTRFPDAVPFAGGTEFSLGKASRLMDLPNNIISLEKIQELHKITRTERYLELSSMVRLNDLIRIGKIIPEILKTTVKQIANPPLRNLATIGGNICYTKRKLDIHAPLSALDAMYELRTASSSRWIAASRFNIKDDPTSNLGKQELLTRIRIPLENWDYTIFKRFEQNHLPSSENGVIVFIAKAQKNIISDVRLVFAGESLIRNRNFETLLSGQQLPLDRKAASNFVGLWETYLTELPYPNGLLAAKILNFIRSTIQDLTK
jgi:CO/xanthine dehydrogenase FAD-binding subunit